MDISLIGANIVILAKNHNPSIVSKEWLSQKGIIEDEVVSFTHTPAFSVVETENFSFFADPDRLQLNAKVDIPNKVDLLPQMILSYVDALPETPYTSIGFNFVYNIKMGKSTLENIYGHNIEKLESLFHKDYQLGGIIKYKFDEMIVRLILEPDTSDEMKADFNFHCQLDETKQISNIIERHSDAMKESENILEGLISE